MTSFEKKIPYTISQVQTELSTYSDAMTASSVHDAILALGLDPSDPVNKENINKIKDQLTDRKNNTSKNENDPMAPELNPLAGENFLEVTLEYLDDLLVRMVEIVEGKRDEVGEMIEGNVKNKTENVEYNVEATEKLQKILNSNFICEEVFHRDTENFFNLLSRAVSLIKEEKANPNIINSIYGGNCNIIDSMFRNARGSKVNFLNGEGDREKRFISIVKELYSVGVEIKAFPMIKLYYSKEVDFCEKIILDGVVLDLNNKEEWEDFIKSNTEIRTGILNLYKKIDVGIIDLADCYNESLVLMIHDKNKLEVDRLLNIDGIDLNYETRGETPLLASIQENTEEYDIELFKSLIKKGANKITSFQKVAENKDSRYLEELIKNEIVNVNDRQELATYLYYAAAESLENVKLLVNSGADISVKDKFDHDALSIAAGFHGNWHHAENIKHEIFDCGMKKFYNLNCKKYI